MTEIKITYGRKLIDGKLCGYARFKDENGDTIELISPPYGDLKKYINGQPAPVTTEDVFLWTEVAGWLGTDELLNALGIKRDTREE